MKAILIGLCCLIGSGALAAEKPQPRPFAWYRAQYPFMRHMDTTFTQESELRWPDGYHRLDSAALTKFQFWMTNLPMWYSGRDAARVAGLAFKAKDISCVVHLPWRSVRYFDYTIPVQLYLEYCLMRGDTASFVYLPRAGETITPATFLSGSPISYRGQELKFEPADSRPASEKELDAMFDLCAKWSDYGVLAKNAEPVDTSDLRPGDMLIAQKKVPTYGRVFVILNILENDKGERLYLVGTGDTKPCDFYIPLANDDKLYPWLTLSQLVGLASDYPTHGFFRFPIDF